MKRIIALDVGSHTIGVAQSDLLKTIAQPVKTLRYQEDRWNLACQELAQIVDLSSVETIVIGLPKNMNNTLGDSAIRSERFADFLKTFLSQSKLDQINIVFSDERLTTVQAEKMLISADVKRKNRKKVIDTVAAVLILQNYL